MSFDSTMAGHAVLGVLITAFWAMTRHQIRRITIEFKNGKPHVDLPAEQRKNPE